MSQVWLSYLLPKDLEKTVKQALLEGVFQISKADLITIHLTNLNTNSWSGLYAGPNYCQSHVLVAHGCELLRHSFYKL